MTIKQDMQETLKKILIGRDKIKIFDNYIYNKTNGLATGWTFANHLRNMDYGRRKYISDAPIVFIGCFPRSGSTLLTAMLERHKDIAGIGYERHIFQELKDFQTLKDGFKFHLPEIKQLRKYEYDTVLHAHKTIKKFLQKEKKKLFLLKQPKHIFFIDEIFKHFPKSKFIHIIRDGRDATMSQRYFLLPDDRDEWDYSWCCRNWTMCIRKGEQFRNDKRYMEVRYEDLVNKPKKTLKKVTDFLNIKFSEDLLGFYKSFDLKKRPQHKAVGKPLDKSNINKWVKKMTADDKITFASICRREQINLGYKVWK